MLHDLYYKYRQALYSYMNSPYDILYGEHKEIVDGNEVTVLFPYISIRQMDDWNSEHIFTEETEPSTCWTVENCIRMINEEFIEQGLPIEYRNLEELSKGASTWEFFTAAFSVNLADDIIRFDEGEAHIVYLLIGGEILPLNISSLAYSSFLMNTLQTESEYKNRNIQAMFFESLIPQVNWFLPLDMIGSNLSIAAGEIVSAAVLSPCLNKMEDNIEVYGDELFAEYVLNQLCYKEKEYIISTLNSIFPRIASAENVWCLDALNALNSYSKGRQLNDCQKTALDIIFSFCNHIIKSSISRDNSVFAKSLPPTYFTSVPKEVYQLKNAYKYLIENEWIEENIEEDEFLFFFNGRGKASNKKILWNEAKKYLALFVAAISNGDDRWSVASQIFEIRNNKTGMYTPVSNKLRNNYYEATNISDKNKQRENESLIEDIFA